MASQPNNVTQLKPPGTLSSALAAAFAQIESATKDAVNPAFKAGGKVSKYADLTAVIEAIKPALIANDLFFTQRPQPHDHGICVETVVGHISGEEKSLGTLFVPANKNDAQGFGSALTYARRYALVTAFGVPVEDDDGNAAASASARKPVAAASDAQPISDADWAKIVGLCQATGTQGNEVKAKIGAANLKVLTGDQFNAAVDYLEGKLADKAKTATNAKGAE